MALNISKYFLSETSPASKILNFVEDLLLLMCKQDDNSNGKVLPNACVYNEEFQRKILCLTVCHPKAIMYPPSRGYQKEFLKSFLTKLEDLNVEIIDDIYFIYSELISGSLSGELFSYRTYFLDKEHTLSVTLQESKCFVINSTTGLQTWEAAKHLAEWCCKEDILRNKSILELGCGIGLTGLTVCCLSQPRKYIFTDTHPQVLDMLRKNLHLNHDNLHNQTQLDVRKLDWEEEVDSTWNEPMDIILASDVVFDPSLFHCLVKVLRVFLSQNPNCEALLACTVRNQQSQNYFLEILESLKMKIQCYKSQKPKLFFSADSAVDILKIRL